MTKLYQRQEILWIPMPIGFGIGCLVAFFLSAAPLIGGLVGFLSFLIFSLSIMWVSYHCDSEQEQRYTAVRTSEEEIEVTDNDSQTQNPIVAFTQFKTAMIGIFNELWENNNNKNHYGNKSIDIHYALNSGFEIYIANQKIGRNDTDLKKHYRARLNNFETRSSTVLQESDPLKQLEGICHLYEMNLLTYSDTAWQKDWAASLSTYEKTKEHSGWNTLKQTWPNFLCIELQTLRRVIIIFLPKQGISKNSLEKHFMSELKKIANQIPHLPSPNAHPQPLSIPASMSLSDEKLQSPLDPNVRKVKQIIIQLLNKHHKKENDSACVLLHSSFILRMYQPPFQDHPEQLICQLEAIKITPLLNQEDHFRKICEICGFTSYQFIDIAQWEEKHWGDLVAYYNGDQTNTDLKLHLLTNVIDNKMILLIPDPKIIPDWKEGGDNTDVLHKFLFDAYKPVAHTL